MAYTTITKNTPNDPKTVNDNFQHIGAGDMLPRGGTDLSVTNSVYNLGSSDYRYAELHVDTANITNSIPKAWNLLSRQMLSATAARVEFSGLNGDQYSLFHIITRVVVIQTATAENIYMHLNGDSASNYVQEYMECLSGGALTCGRFTATGIAIGNKVASTATLNQILSETYLYAKSGNFRTSISHSVITGSKFTKCSDSRGAYWSNTADTVTSIVFTCSRLDTMSSFEIWGMEV